MMRLVCGAVALILSMGQADAQDCPAFFRFVDFGLTGRDGAVYRGGAIFRAESLEGEVLLLRERTVCLGVRDVSRDGHGNPIPVVTRIEYDPARARIGVSELAVSVVMDAAAAAESAAEAHRRRVQAPGAVPTVGADFLCLSGAGSDADGGLSCQLASPYPGNAALVVRCAADVCDMPALAITETLLVSATWPMPEAVLDDPGRAGPEILERVQKIRDFLAPLSAALSGR